MDHYQYNVPFVSQYSDNDPYIYINSPENYLCLIIHYLDFVLGQPAE